MFKRFIIPGIAAVSFVGGACALANPVDRHPQSGLRCLAEDKKEEGKEEKVTIDQVPAAVKETLLKEAGGGAIKDIDKETEDGKVQYEVDVVIDGKNFEIVVAEDGKLVSKKLDEEKDEKDGKDKKDEK